MPNQKMVEFHPENLKNIVAQMLDEAKKQGATSAEADISYSNGFTVSARQGDVESVEYNKDKSLSISVYFGKRTGCATLSDIEPEAIKSAVKAACNIARFTDEDEYSGLPEKELLAFNYPELEMSFPWDITVDDAIKLACECENRALSKDKRIIHSEGVTLSTNQGWHAYGNSLGFIGAFPSTRHDMSCVLVGKNGNEMQRDHDYTVAVDPLDLKSIYQLADDAVHRTVRRLGARRIPTQRVPVIFIAEEARHFLGHFISAIQGSSLYRKSSFLLDHLGKKIFPSHIRIEEKPHLAKELGTVPFDDDGVATRENVFIDNGILNSYALSVYSARKLGMKTTGNAGGVHNLYITTASNDLAGLMKKMGKGLVVTELLGHGINMVTGDYSRGMAGFWVEDGVIQFPVEEVTIAGNLKDLYLNLVEVGNDVDHRGNIKTGSILLEEMMVAGD